MSEVDKLLKQNFESHILTAKELAIIKLKEADNFCQELKKAAEIDVSCGEQEDEVYSKVYNCIFTQLLCRKVRNLISSDLNSKLDYVDPDTTYRDDSLAFIDAFHEFMEPYYADEENTTTYKQTEIINWISREISLSMQQELTFNGSHPDLRNAIANIRANRIISKLSGNDVPKCIDIPVSKLREIPST